MRKKTVKIVAIIIACLLALGIAAPIFSIFVFAAEKDDVIKEYEEKEKSALNDLHELEIQINEAGEKIFQSEKTVGEIDEKLNEINAELMEIENQEQQQMDKFKSRVTAVCENGSVSYLELIFSAESISDFMDKIVIAAELAEYDKNIIDSMQKVKEGIQTRKTEQEALKAEQEKAKAELDTAMAELQQKSAEAAAYLEELKNDKKAYEQYLDAKAAEERLAKQQAGISTGNGNADVSKVASGTLIWPTVATRITSSFSPNRVNPVSGVLRPHTGTDIGGSDGDPVYASDGGTVTFAQTNGGYGNCVIIDHGNGVSTLYAHLSAIMVSKGESVGQGQQIGRVGSTGNSTGPHLHFEVIIDGTAVDAMQFF